MSVNKKRAGHFAGKSRTQRHHESAPAPCSALERAAVARKVDVMKAPTVRRCFFWEGNCGYKAVAEIFSHGKWKPICGQHLAALRRRKRGLKPQERPLSDSENTCP